MEHHIQHISTTHETYIQDTPDFLRMINKINRGPKLRKQAILATLDVDGLFTNITHTEGLQTLQNKLQEKQNKDTPVELIMKLMELILYNNIFSFHDSLWIQLIGAAMGSKPVPAYANIFMDKIYQIIKTLAKQYDEGDQKALQLMKRFLDDIFIIFHGTTKKLHELLD